MSFNEVDKTKMTQTRLDFSLSQRPNSRWLVVCAKVADWCKSRPPGPNSVTLGGFTASHKIKLINRVHPCTVSLVLPSFLDTSVLITQSHSNRYVSHPPPPINFCPINNYTTLVVL